MEFGRRGFVQLGVSVVVPAASGCLATFDGDGTTEADRRAEENAPAIVLDFQRSGGELVIEHGGGEGVPGDEITIRGPVEDENPNGDLHYPGDSITVELAGDASPGDTVEVVWHDSESGGEATLGSYTLEQRA